MIRQQNQYQREFLRQMIREREENNFMHKIALNYENWIWIANYIKAYCEADKWAGWVCQYALEYLNQFRYICIWQCMCL